MGRTGVRSEDEMFVRGANMKWPDFLVPFLDLSYGHQSNG